VARTSWFDEKAEHEAIQERVNKLESFTSALADGVVSWQELTGQEQRLVFHCHAFFAAKIKQEGGRAGEKPFLGFLPFSLSPVRS
jgi:hypothetical protein